MVLDRFNVERAMEAGVRPGPMYAMLQQGRDVTLRDGTVVCSSHLTGWSFVFFHEISMCILRISPRP